MNDKIGNPAYTVLRTTKKVSMKKELINQIVELTIEQINLQVYLQLCFDVYQYGLYAEFAEFILENPGLDMIEIDRQFRSEWDL